MTKESLKRGPERPLVIAIDDDPAILELLRATIEHLGRSFLGASSLAQGHELLRSNQPELLVIDGMLPDGSGLDFVTQVLSAQGEATLPVVFLSAFFKDMGSYERLRQAGARKILHKPITPESLLAELGELLIVANGSTDVTATGEAQTQLGLQEELQRLAESYRAGLPDLADQLEHWHGQLEQESKGAASQLVALLHRVAGSAGTHRLHSISLLAGDLEKRIERRERVTGWSSQWQELIATMRQNAVATQPRASRQDSPCQGAVDVLLVDDDPEIGRALIPVMRRRCMELRQVHSYDEAERSLAARTPNLMVLDYHLGPGQTGPEIAPALAQYLPASCPTVFLSTHDDIDKRALAAESGGALYLSKSMGVEAIVESISTLLVRGLASAALALASNDTEVARVVSEGLQGSIASLDTAGDPMALWHLLEKQRYDLLLIDGQLPGYGGPEMCRILKSDVRYQELPVVLLTAADDPAAVQSAMAAAADGWLDRRADRDQLLRVLTSLLQRRASSRVAEDQAATSAADRSRPAALPRATSFQGLVGNSPPMQEVFRRLQLAARSDTTVVVTGPSGTGKELAAHALHNLSVRSAGPFVAISCAAIPETLLESELFGHVRGAFTSAVRDKTGVFQAANGGTLFIDEVEDISLPVQAKLLRALQEREIRRVGDEKSVAVDVRIVAATNRDLESLVENGRMREDFFYRLNVFSISMPPLIERAEDIPLLVDSFVAVIAKASSRPVPTVTRAALARLCEHDWPGNVRQLKNALEHAFVVMEGDQITADDLPPLAQDQATPATTDAEQEPRLTAKQRRERDEILVALEKSDGNRTQAAELLGYSRVTLWKKMKKLGVKA